jgi:hypothetical protein
MVHLGFLHASLPAGFAEEVQHVVKGEFPITDDVGERSALTILKKRGARDGDVGH